MKADPQSCGEKESHARGIGSTLGVPSTVFAWRLTSLRMTGFGEMNDSPPTDRLKKQAAWRRPFPDLQTVSHFCPPAQAELERGAPIIFFSLSRPAPAR